MFNKSEYDKQYQKDNIKRFALDMRKEEYEAFCDYCTNINVNRSAYLKSLVNEDAKKRGLECPFKEKK